jgi:hypothetical protein
MEELKTSESTNPTTKAGRFLASLHEEKLRSQERRGTLVLRKLTWVTGLFAIGSLKVTSLGTATLDFILILYVVPVVSIVFDLYITGENYGVKRMGAFVRQHMPEEYEGIWEAWLRDKRDVFSRYALPLSSLVVLTVSCLILMIADGDAEQTPWVVVLWAIANLSAILFVNKLAARVLSGLDPDALDRELPKK